MTYFRGSEEESDAELKLAAMDLEETAREVSSVAVDETIVVPDGKAYSIHYVNSQSTAYQDIVTGVLGHVAQCAVIYVIFNAGVLQFSAGSQSKVERRTGNYQELDIITDRKMKIEVEGNGEIRLVEGSLAEFERQVHIASGKIADLDTGSETDSTFYERNLIRQAKRSAIKVCSCTS